MIRLIILKILFRKEVEIMAMIYASLIIKGRKTFAQVPATLKEQVKQILVDCECEHLATEE